MRLGALLFACLASFAAHGISFLANPIRLTLAPGAMSTSLSLENTGGEPVLIQAEVMSWTQRNGEDQLAPTRDVVVSPPIFNLGPGATQIVRVGLLKPANSEREVTYRIFLQEVPQPPKPGAQGVNVALRLGLPLFVLPPGGATPQLAWRAKAEGDRIRLSLSNSGNGHVQAVSCRLYREDGALLADEQLGAYVLAGQTRSWLIRPKEPWRGGKLRIALQTAGGEVVTEFAAQ